MLRRCAEFGGLAGDCRFCGQEAAATTARCRLKGTAQHATGVARHREMVDRTRRDEVKEGQCTVRVVVEIVGEIAGISVEIGEMIGG